MRRHGGEGDDNEQPARSQRKGRLTKERRCDNHDQREQVNAISKSGKFRFGHVANLYSATTKN